MNISNNKKSIKSDFCFVTFILLFCVSPVAKSDTYQYCAEASSRITKMICDPGFHDGNLLSLDYEMSLIYGYALFATKNSATLKKSQRNWLKKRDLCQDKACVIESNKNRIRDLVAIIDGHPNKPASPENNELKGLWYASSGASRAIYGTILITDHTLMWGEISQFPTLIARLSIPLKKSRLV